MTEMIDLLMDTDPEVMYPIYVPSYKRAGKAPILELLAKAPEHIQAKVHIVARASDSKAYRKAYPWATIVEQYVPWGIGPARIVCLEHADEMGYKRIVMLDDDITKVGFLIDNPRTDGVPASRRFSHRDTPWESWEFTLHCLAFGCEMADAVFSLAKDAAYGSTRSAFMSHAVDVEQIATLEGRGFPLCVMYIDVERFSMRDMPRAFQYEGEDLAMFLDAYEKGYSTFLFNSLIFDDDRNLTTTIPFSGDGEIDRTGNLEDAEARYKVLGPYLKVTNRNPVTGAIKRIGVDWRRWHRERGTGMTHVMAGDVISHIEAARA